MSDINNYDMAWDIYADLEGSSDERRSALPAVLAVEAKSMLEEGLPITGHDLKDLYRIVTDLIKSDELQGQHFDNIKAYLQGEGYDCLHPLNPEYMWWRGDGIHQTLMDHYSNGDALPVSQEMMVVTDYTDEGKAEYWDLVTIPLHALKP